MLKIKTVTMEEKIIDILSEIVPVSHKDFNQTVKELLNLFPVIKCGSDFHYESLKQFGSCSDCSEWVDKK